MIQLTDYAKELVTLGDQLLSEYCSFLLTFKNNINRNDILNDYLLLDRYWQNKIYKNYRVLKKIDPDRKIGYDPVLINKCQDIIENIKHSIDIDMSQLQDEICSLNKKNSLFGLKYNRYQTKNGLTPQYIDIKS